MAKKVRWSRYQPPSEQRDEDGRRAARPAMVSGATSGGTPTSGSTRSSSKPTGKASGKSSGKSSSKPTGKSSSKSSGKASSGSGSTLPILIGVAVAFVVVVVSIVIASVAGSEDPKAPDIDTEVLSEDFLGKSFDTALRVEGAQVVSLRLSEYGVTLEYFDPNERVTRHFETSTYDDGDGYSVRVQESYYSDYQPRPFDLTTITPAMLIDAVESAIAQADGATYFSATVEADRETGQITIATRVSGDKDATETATPTPVPATPGSGPTDQAATPEETP